MIAIGLSILAAPRVAAANLLSTKAQAAVGDTALPDPSLSLLQAAVNPDPNPTKGDAPLELSQDSALVAEGAAAEASGVAEEQAQQDAAQQADAEAAAKAEAAKKAAAKATAAKAAAAKKAAAPKTKVLHAVSKYFGNPLPGGHLSQGIHDHNAVDLAAPAGTPIYAAAAGTVTMVSSNGSWNGGYGNYVRISHSNGLQTGYAHFSKVVVSDGQKVSKGQLIGYVGETGEATGNHLHFEVFGGVNPFG